MAKLYFRYGAMGASKTANAIMVAYNYSERGQRAVIVKPALDTRDEADVIRSRIGLQAEVVNIGANEDLWMSLLNGDLQPRSANLKKVNGPKLDCIVVDEAQFLTKKQVVQLSGIADQFNIPVICYGLRTDFKGELFPGSKALMAYADSIEEIKTMCWCGKKATFNARVQGEKVVNEGEQVMIGGNEMYVALCRLHWATGKLKD